MKLWLDWQLLVTGDRAEGAAETLTLWAGGASRGRGERFLECMAVAKLAGQGVLRTPLPRKKYNNN